jgi:cholesterol transport system auxiliary component
MMLILKMKLNQRNFYRSLWQKFGFLLLLTAASVPATADTFKRTYLLDVPLPTIAPVNQTGKMLLVSMPKAAPGFNTPAQVYIRTPYQLEYYGKSQWVDTPARMLLPLLVLHLEATGQFKAVLSAMTSTFASELRLDTEIVRLQQEFLTYPSQVRIVLRAQLLDMEARQVLATRVFETTENARGENAEGGMLATNRAVARLLKKLTAFIVELVK